MSGVGFKRPGVECVHCQKPFPLSLGTDAMTAKEVAALPEPFEAECPYCEKVAMYPRSAIGSLVVL